MARPQYGAGCKSQAADNAHAGVPVSDKRPKNCPAGCTPIKVGRPWNSRTSRGGLAGSSPKISRYGRAWAKMSLGRGERVSGEGPLVVEDQRCAFASDRLMNAQRTADRQWSLKCEREAEKGDSDFLMTDTKNGSCGRNFTNLESGS